MMIGLSDCERRLSRRAFALAALGGVGVLATGCSLPGRGEAPRRIRLDAATDFAPDLPSVGWVLLVREPTTTLSLDTARIAIGTGSDIEYLATGEWASRAPAMVMELLVESFQNANRIPTVGDRRARIRPDFTLEAQLTAFHIQRDSADEDRGQVTVRLEPTLVKQPRREAIASIPFEATTEVAPLTLDGIIAAFNESLQEVMSQAVEWTLKTGVAA